MLDWKALSRQDQKTLQCLYGGGPLRSCDPTAILRLRQLGLCVSMLAAVLLTGCSKEPEYNDQQRVCIAKLFKDYDAKQMSQCVNVCKSCMSGSTTTCTTSCTLKGAH